MRRKVRLSFETHSSSPISLEPFIIRRCVTLPQQFDRYGKRYSRVLEELNEDVCHFT